MSVRQTVPIVVGVLWLTVMLMVGLPIVGALGPARRWRGSFGRGGAHRCTRSPSPGSRLAWARLARPLDVDSPHPLPPNDASCRAGLRGSRSSTSHRLAVACSAPVGVVHDRLAGTVSMVLAGRGRGLPCCVTGRTGRPRRLVGCGPGSDRSGSLSDRAGDVAGVVAPGRDRRTPPLPRRRPAAAASTSRRTPTTNGLLDQVGPFTIAHDVHLTVTVDLRRVRSRRGASTLTVGHRDAGRRVPPARDPARGRRLRRRRTAHRSGVGDRRAIAIRPDARRRCVARLAGERSGSDRRRVGADGGAAELVRVPRRRVVASVVSRSPDGRCCRSPRTGWHRC